MKNPAQAQWLLGKEAALFLLVDILNGLALPKETRVPLILKRQGATGQLEGEKRKTHGVAFVAVGTASLSTWRQDPGDPVAQLQPVTRKVEKLGCFLLPCLTFSGLMENP